MVSSFDWSPPFGWPTHSLVPIDTPIAGHRWMLVADEHVQPMDTALSPELPAMVWMVDITDETRPIPVGTFQLPELVGRPSPLMTGWTSRWKPSPAPRCPRRGSPVACG
jgi:hypothetical protein